MQCWGLNWVPRFNWQAPILTFYYLSSPKFLIFKKLKSYFNSYYFIIWNQKLCLLFIQETKSLNVETVQFNCTVITFFSPNYFHYTKVKLIIRNWQDGSEKKTHIFHVIIRLLPPYQLSIQKHHLLICKKNKQNPPPAYSQ